MSSSTPPDSNARPNGNQRSPIDSPTIPPTLLELTENGYEEDQTQPISIPSNTSNNGSSRNQSHSSDSSTQTRTSNMQRPAVNHISNLSYVSSPTSAYYHQVTSPTTTPPLHAINNSYSSVPSSPSQHAIRIRPNSVQHIISHNSRASVSNISNGVRRHNHNHNIDGHHYYRGDSRRNNQPIDLQPPIADIPRSPASAMYWSKVKTHGKSPARALRAHTVNLVGELMYVFGGCDARSCFNNIYIFDADTMYWCKPRVTGDPPPACRAHSSTLVDKKLFIFGGGDGPVYFNDLYIFDTEALTWSQPKTSGNVPSPRRAHTAAYYNNCIYVFGGGDGVRALNDVYRLCISNLNDLVWERLNPTGRPPISRGYHTSNLVDSKLVVYGGSDGHECFRDVHILDLDKLEWRLVEIENSHPRLSHTATQVGSYLFVLCGHDGTRYTSDVLLLNLVTMQWETRRVHGTPPSGRGYHTTVLHDSRLFVFGGYDGHSVFDEVFVLNLSACAYLPQITNFPLPTQ